MSGGATLRSCIRQTVTSTDETLVVLCGPGFTSSAHSHSHRRGAGSLGDVQNQAVANRTNITRISEGSSPLRRPSGPCHAACPCGTTPAYFWPGRAPGLCRMGLCIATCMHPHIIASTTSSRLARFHKYMVSEGSETRAALPHHWCARSIRQGCLHRLICGQFGLGREELLRDLCGERQAGLSANCHRSRLHGRSTLAAAASPIAFPAPAAPTPPPELLHNPQSAASTPSFAVVLSVDVDTIWADQGNTSRHLIAGRAATVPATAAATKLIAVAAAAAIPSVPGAVAVAVAPYGGRMCVGAPGCRLLRREQGIRRVLQDSSLSDFLDYLFVI